MSAFVPGAERLGSLPIPLQPSSPSNREAVLPVWALGHVEDSETQSMDAQAFNKVLASQFKSFQAVVALEYEKSVAELKLENKQLRKLLDEGNDIADQGAVENGGVQVKPQPNAQTNAHSDVKVRSSLFKATSNFDGAPGEGFRSGGREEEPLGQLEINLPDEHGPEGPHQSLWRQVKLQAKMKESTPIVNRRSRITTLGAMNDAECTNLIHNSSLIRLLPAIDHEAQLKGFLWKLVHSKMFESCSALVILANIVVMAFQMQYAGIQNGYDLNMGEFNKSARETWPHAPEVFFGCNVAFNAVFVLEFLLRVVVEGSTTVHSGWMWFDFIIVSSSVCDLLLTLPMNPIMMRILRLVRIMRIVKMLKTMESFASLFLLIKGIVASYHAAVWSFLLLTSIQLVVGFFFCQALQDFIEDTNEPDTARKDIYLYFGTFTRTFFTMFEVTSGNWVPCGRALLEHVGEVYAGLLVLYRCMFISAVVKVSAAVFITETNQVLDHDDDLRFMKHTREQKVYKAKIEKILAAIKKYHQGDLSMEKIETLVQYEDISELVSPLGFNNHDLLRLFWLLDDGSGKVAPEAFFNNLNNFRGPSRMVEDFTTLKLLHTVYEDIQNNFDDGPSKGSKDEQKAVQVGF